MKKDDISMAFIIFNIIVTLAFVGFVFWKILPPRGVEQLRTPELRELLEDKESYQFIDVRAPQQFQQFHIYGFDNIPLNEIKEAAKHLSKDKKVVFICPTGTKGNEACKRLKRRGFTDLANVQGGLSAWDQVHIDQK